MCASQLGCVASLSACQSWHPLLWQTRVWSGQQCLEFLCEGGNDGLSNMLVIKFDDARAILGHNYNTFFLIVEGDKDMALSPAALLKAGK